MREETFVYRAPMRSRDDAVPRGAGTERALALGVCGIGGRLHPAPDSLQDALTLADAQSGIRLAWRIERFAKAPIGSFVWTRDVDELTYLGRLVGPWAYDTDDAADAVDLVHVRACDWLAEPIADEMVPPDVQAAFGRGGRNWQRIRATSVGAPTRAVWDAVADE
ncbi:GAF domain-containing protein [Microbacterium hydrocarbonoxydans]|uniref:GAF domain-containing protein n=1 Tax=Microbacterium hydrocarbonoxydans TaxID=273678 RepID=UPI0020404809|nr:GAF domain-containing protein [Microbacterium hydrocarbonoxydans]MCM3779480.1 GAF domain-containing protein [Microbacterium hydrocarbonoxydans]